MHKFTFPLTLSTIRAFCHPDEWHSLHDPEMIDGVLYAGNTRIAIRAERGYWLAGDFPKPNLETAERFGKLPWDALPAASPEWVPLDNLRGDIFARGRIFPWTEDHKISPCPVWQVAGSHLIRLSHLQMLTMLPGSEIYAGPAHRDAPCFVRFSGGGIAIVPPDRLLKTHSRAILAPAYHPLRKNERIARSDKPTPSFVPPPPPEPEIENWPPQDASEI